MSGLVVTISRPSPWCRQVVDIVAGWWCAGRTVVPVVERRTWAARLSALTLHGSLNSSRYSFW